MAAGFFISGTDTGVGKTFVATSLIRGLVRKGQRVTAMKPVASGSQRTRDGLRNDDALALRAAANVATRYETVNPYCFEPAIAPHIAAREAGIVIDLEVIRRDFAALSAQSDCVIVEGAGGWLAPIGTAQADGAVHVDESVGGPSRPGAASSANGALRTMADIAATVQLPVILVVGLRLGCLNHALLTAAAIKASGLRLSHWIANELSPAFERRRENVATLSDALGAPLALVPFDSDGDRSRGVIDVSL